MKAVKLCRDCGRPIKNATNFRVVCDECRRKKAEAKREEVRSLENEDAARRAAEQGKKKKAIQEPGPMRARSRSHGHQLRPVCGQGAG